LVERPTWGGNRYGPCKGNQTSYQQFAQKPIFRIEKEQPRVLLGWRSKHCRVGATIPSTSLTSLCAPDLTRCYAIDDHATDRSVPPSGLDATATASGGGATASAEWMYRDVVVRPLCPTSAPM
jgi:hypothetical protein